MHVKRLLITIIAAIYAAAMVCIATPESDLRATDSLYVLLKTAKTPADSLPLLYDLYDLGSRQDNAEPGDISRCKKDGQCHRTG